MNEIAGILVLLSGCAVFIASLFYAASARRSRRHTQITGTLLERASAASRMPAQEREAEYAAIKQVFKDLSDDEQQPLIPLPFLRKSHPEQGRRDGIGRGIL
jgi:hypothetical protein